MSAGVNQIASQKISQMIEEDLAVGASSQQIEFFLKEHNITFSYDKLSKRYQGIIRDVSLDPKVDQAIVIEIYVDDQMKFIRAEVHDSFTMP